METLLVAQGHQLQLTNCTPLVPTNAQSFLAHFQHNPYS